MQVLAAVQTTAATRKAVRTLEKIELIARTLTGYLLVGRAEMTVKWKCVGNNRRDQF